jgi:uncharacterized OsmC-like protein
VDDRVLVLKRIHVTYRLEVDEDADREKIERSHEIHASRCPVARSIGAAVDITTDIEVLGSGA